MANVAKGKKKILAIAVIACLAVALVAVPAFAFYYVHSEDNTQNATGKGAMEICLTIDQTSIGGGVKTDLMFIPNEGTVADVLEEGVLSSESQNGLKAIHNYDTESLKDYLADHKYTIAVYETASQKPGTQTTYDTDSLSDSEDYVLSRFNDVVVTVTK